MAADGRDLGPGPGPGPRDQGARLRAALVGAGISGSLTPAMHQAEGRAQGLRYSYSLIDTDTRAFGATSLADILETAQAQGMCGLNITHPYKGLVVGHLDRLSPEAARLGAVNTVVFRDGERIGHNTDFSGFGASFRRFQPRPQGNRVLLLGAGGAGSAVAFALVQAGVCDLLVHDIDMARARALVGRLDAHFAEARGRALVQLTSETTKDLHGIVNATPMGMDRHPGCAFPAQLLAASMWVVDIVYFPRQTRLLAQARARGCRVLPGAGMAVHQAVAAFALFTGKAADADRMAATFEQASGGVPKPPVANGGRR